MLTSDYFTHPPFLSLSLSLSLPSPPSLSDLWLLLIINVIVCIIGAIIDQGKLITMGVSILYLVLFAPASLFCWFLPTYYAYKWVDLDVVILNMVIIPPPLSFFPSQSLSLPPHTFRKDSSLAFMWIFFVLFFQGLSLILNAIGIPNLGAA